MAESLASWVKHAVDPYRDAPEDWLLDYHFHRDPTRTITLDSNAYFAPADGTIIYQKVVEADDEPIVTIKGREFTLEDACHRPMPVPSLVVGIFLTVWDVHVQRAARSGRCDYWQLPPVETENRSMTPVEEALEHGDVQTDLCDYLFVNERVLNRFRTSQNDEHFVLQVADVDVDAITPFGPSGEHFGQGDRFSAIRFGSQVDLIVPLSRKLRPAHKVGTHVEAGLDVLATIG